MTIGAAWNIDDPAKPWTDFDPHADIKIPFGFDEWLLELGVAYQDHQVITAAPLECADKGTYTDGRALVRMRVATGATYSAGLKYPFTIRVFGADGTTKDDRTLYLRIVER